MSEETVTGPDWLTVHAHVHADTPMRLRLCEAEPEGTGSGESGSVGMLALGEHPPVTVFFHDARSALELAIELIELHREWTEPLDAEPDAGGEPTVNVGGDLPPW